MNDPKRIENLERRVERLEQDRDGIVEGEKLLLKLSKYHRAGLQELNGKAERLELLQGETNERLDGADQTLKRYEGYFKDIEQKQGTHTELLGDLIAVGEEHTKRFAQLERRFDRVEATQAEHSAMLREHSAMLREQGALLKEILARLPEQK
jgi:chromosome segregation ATPase